MVHSVVWSAVATPYVIIMIYGRYFIALLFNDGNASFNQLRIPVNVIAI